LSAAKTAGSARLRRSCSRARWRHSSAAARSAAAATAQGIAVQIAFTVLPDAAQSVFVTAQLFRVAAASRVRPVAVVRPSTRQRLYSIFPLLGQPCSGSFVFEVS